MTFSEFAKMLFPYIGSNLSKAEFVIELVRNVMKGPTLKKDVELDKVGKYIPLPEEIDSLNRIFNGTRPISKKNARKILSRLDRERFELYIDDFPDDTIDLIRLDLREKGVDPADDGVGSVCADLFVSALRDCANKERKPRKKSVLGQQAVAGQIIFDTIKSDDTIEIGGNESQEAELSEPQYYREYCQDSLKKFEIYAAWNPEPLDPELKEKWGAKCITDEFCKSIKDYGIAHFLEIAPSDFRPMKRVVTEGNVVDCIRSAVRFVEYMEPAMDYMLISKENEKIFNDIADFTVLLRRYLNFLKENSNNSDLFANEFILMISDDKELEQEANEYYGNLRARLENLEKQLEAEDECKT